MQVFFLVLVCFTITLRCLLLQVLITNVRVRDSMIIQDLAVGGEIHFLNMKCHGWVYKTSLAGEVLRIFTWIFHLDATKTCVHMLERYLTNLTPVFHNVSYQKLSWMIKQPNQSQGAQSFLQETRQANLLMWKQQNLTAHIHPAVGSFSKGLGKSYSSHHIINSKSIKTSTHNTPR